MPKKIRPIPCRLKKHKIFSNYFLILEWKVKDKTARNRQGNSFLYLYAVE